MPVTLAVARPLRQVTSSAPNSNRCNVQEKSGPARVWRLGVREHRHTTLQLGGVEGGTQDRGGDSSTHRTTEECRGVSGNRGRERMGGEGTRKVIGSLQPVKGELNKTDLFQRK